MFFANKNTKLVSSPNSYAAENGETTLDNVKNDAGLGYFLKNVYTATGLGFNGALASSFVFLPAVRQLMYRRFRQIVTG